MIRPGVIAAAPILILGANSNRPASATKAGLTYDFVVRMDRTSPDGKTSGGIALKGHASVLGDRVRVDFDPNGAPPAMNGAYFLSNDAGAHAIVVATRRHQATEMPMPVLIQKFSNSSGKFGGLLNQATDVRIDVQNDGAGPAIFGQPTMHYKLTEAKTINGKVPNAALHERDSVTTDLYYAPGLKNFINPFLLEPPLAGRLDGLGAEDRDLYLAARAGMFPGLAPLRAITRETTTGADGKVISIAVVAMVTRMKADDVDPALFEIPEGYSTSVTQGPQ